MDSIEEKKENYYEIPNFEQVFPNLISQIQLIAKEKIPFLNKLFGQYPKIFTNSCDQISEKIQQWNWLKQQSNNKVVYHVYKMIYSLVSDTDYQQLNQVDQNILIWAALLHDICKIGKPTIDGKDHCHPFKSGYETLKIFHQLKYIELTEDQVKEWELIFRDAYFPCKGEKGKFIHNNEVVDKVKEFLDKIYGNHQVNPQKEIILLIFLHQSLDLIKEYPPKTPLEEKYYKLLLNERFLDLMYFIAVHDSRSYKLCKAVGILVPKFSKLQLEVRKNIKNLKEFIGKEHDKNQQFTSEQVVKIFN